jgi:hypothetical protein
MFVLADASVPCRSVPKRTHRPYVAMLIRFLLRGNGVREEKQFEAVASDAQAVCCSDRS